MSTVNIVGVNLDLSKVSQRTLNAIYSELHGEYEAKETALAKAKASLDLAQREFDSVAGTMKAIKQAILPASANIFRSYRVPSSVSKGTEYTVNLLMNGKYACSCQSFIYQSGTDHNGQCKHIRNVRSNTGGARQVSR